MYFGVNYLEFKKKSIEGISFSVYFDSKLTNSHGRKRSLL